MRAAITVFLLGCFQPFFVLGDISLRGILTIYSSDSVISQPYPVEYGTRTIDELASSSLQFDCAVCDPGAPTEHCFEDIGVCATLSNTTVSIIGTDGAQLNTLPLDPQCTPRYLQRLDMEVAVVVCHDSCFHVITRTGSTFELHPIVCGTGQGGIVIRTRTHHRGHPSYILIELNGNHIFESDLSGAGPTIDITPHTNCADYLSLIPLHTQENFMLLCNTTAGQRVYIVNRFNRDDAPSVELNNAPISSPDGRTFAAAAGSVLKLYRSNNLAQYPGVKDFGVDITLCTYLNSATLLVGLDGGGQIMIYVEAFIDSVGAEGFTPLPYTSSLSRIHKLITLDVYATSNKTDTLHNVLLFNITSGQALDPVSGLLEELLNIFFQHVMASPTLDWSSTSRLSSTPDPTVTPTPTPTQVTKPLFTSALQPSLSVQFPTPTLDDPTEGSPQQKWKEFVVPVYVVAGLVVVGIAALLCLFVYVFRERQSKCSWFGKTHFFIPHGPYGQESDPEKGGSIHMRPSQNGFKSFVSIVPSFLRSSCGNLQFPSPIPESTASKPSSIVVAQPPTHP